MSLRYGVIVFGRFTNQRDGSFGLLEIEYALLPNRECKQKQKHKKQPWSNVECFAFGGATVRFASLETSFHAANHTVPPPPSYEGYPHCPKDKNRSPFHGEKPLMTKWFLGKNRIKFFKTITNIWVWAWFFTSAYNQYNTFINSYLIQTQLLYSTTHNAFGLLFVRVFG